MADTSSCPGMNIYRLRVVIAGIGVSVRNDTPPS